MDNAAEFESGILSLSFSGNTGSPDYIYEPGRQEILKELIPRAVEGRFFLTCLNSLASEHGARMTAMDSATRNAEEMISKLTLHMNRTRQAAITKELMEIIGGAEALKEAMQYIHEYADEPHWSEKHGIEP